MTLKTKIAKLAVCSAALGMASTALAQDEAYDPGRAAAYAETLTRPDWTGIWYPDWSALFANRAQPPQLTPAAQEAFDAYQASISENGPDQTAQAQCLPPGIPGTLQQPYPIEILFSPGRTTIITEAYEQVFRIYTDGRELPEDPDPFFKGNIVGTWEGDVLLFEVAGLHPETNISNGIPHTEASRVSGKIHRPSEDLLMIEMSISNPDVLEVPYEAAVAFQPDNDFPIREYVCAENNRLHNEGDGANIDLGFDILDEEE